MCWARNIFQAAGSIRGGNTIEVFCFAEMGACVHVRMDYGGQHGFSQCVTESWLTCGRAHSLRDFFCWRQVDRIYFDLIPSEVR
jgi:hypothetical protein